MRPDLPKEFNTIAVIGAGGWGTALAQMLALQGYGVKLWVYESELWQIIKTQHENTYYLSGVILDKKVKPYLKLAEVVEGQELLVLAVPCQVLRSVMIQLIPFLPSHPIIVTASKGIEKTSLLTCSQVIEETLPREVEAKVVALSGPSFAREVAKGLPTAVVAASANIEIASLVQKIFSTSYFRVYTNRDIIGVELGGALKNVIAIAAGVSDGLQLGDNARAALITRGLAEITRLGIAMGASPLTFLGLAGLGDLVLTCAGQLSRNRTVGIKLSQGQKLERILQDMMMVAEGVETVKAAIALGQKYQLELPICEAVYSLLYEDKDPRQGVMDLMTRALKEEFNNDLSTFLLKGG
jgi:glycerol-3-phosphate dehydrogenase (NAD(P)+)